MSDPYKRQVPRAFWQTGVVQENPYFIDGIYRKKFSISPEAEIATAGSCFAQHVSRYLKGNGYNILDVEPAPPGLPEVRHKNFGYSLYSARYGNIYTVRHLRQLAEEAAGLWHPSNCVWEKNGKFFDALRPSVEPDGLNSVEEVQLHRNYHVSLVRELFFKLDVFVFTLGLTEMWVDRESGTVFPTAPGVVAGNFDEDKYIFENARNEDILTDFSAFQEALNLIRNGRPFSTILTVSPVPLTATASKNHVLVANSYSKASLRSVAEVLTSGSDLIDYFPSYEIINNPRLHSSAFEHNLRSVRSEFVHFVMQHFFNEHPPLDNCRAGSQELLKKRDEEDVCCDEMLIEAFGK